MAAEDDKIKYRDIIEPDDSIEKLISELSELNKSYETMVNAIRAGADRIVYSIKSASGATTEGRKAIDEAAIAASRLEKAQKELAIAMSSTGQQIAVLKSQTTAANRASVERANYLKQETDSYARMKTDLRQMVDLYNSLSKSERESADMGKALLNDIISLTQQIRAHDDALRIHISQMNAVTQAQQKLDFLMSEEGQKLLDLKAKIAEVTNSRKTHKAAIDPLVEAEERLKQAQSEENQKLKEKNILIHEANRVAKLNAQINLYDEGSYNRLAAQYELNKIKLNAMSEAKRKGTEAGRALEQETKKIYEDMKALQEATGKHTLSVGDYGKVWDRLGFSINQVVREMPALAIDFNTFFLAISNNIPMVIDEINKMRKANEALNAQGEETTSVWESVISAFFSWNTALVVGLTILSVYGKDLIAWVGSLFKAKKEIMSAEEQLNALNEEFKNQASTFGKQIVKLKQLSGEWKELRTEAEKQKWIKGHTSDFNSLGLAIDDVNKANRAFIEDTDAVIEAFRLRAKAAAASKIAEDKYLEAEQKRFEAENLREKDTGEHSFFDVAEAQRIARFYTDPKYYGGRNVQGLSYETRLQIYLSNIESASEQKAKQLEEEAKTLEKEGDAFFEKSDYYTDKEERILGDLYQRFGKTKTEIDKTGRKPRDLTDVIERNQIEIEKAYQKSITSLISDEYSKRKKEAEDSVNTENDTLRDKYRKNLAYIANVDNKYKELTEKQKKQIEQQNLWIIETITNNEERLARQLEDIEREQALTSLKIRRNVINSLKAITGADSGLESQNYEVTRNIGDLEKSYEDERDIEMRNLAAKYDLLLKEAEKQKELGIETGLSELDIMTEFYQKQLEIISKYDTQIFNLRKTDIENQLKLVEKSSAEELRLLLKQNENARNIAIAKNLGLPADKQVSTDTINAEYNKKARLLAGQSSQTAFEQQQELESAQFNAVERGENEITKFKLEQEKARWQFLIDLAEAGALEWSQAQIDTAKATVNGIDNQLALLGNFWEQVKNKGLGETLLSNLGLDEKYVKGAVKGINTWLNTTLGFLQDIAAAEVELAEKAVEAAEKRTEAAQSAYEAEVEARNNGYANNVASARRDWELEKKKQRDKEKLLEEAKKRQEAINTVVQASSLITASANLWASLSPIPIVGHTLALAAIATMWASFAAAKIKARQVTAASEEYGEGGLEFLEGGSHASGNDIDLGVNNKRKKRMRAEGGEALAIINKKRTRKYRRILPDVIDSFNKGTFEDKYLNAFDNADKINSIINVRGDMDLSGIEKEVRAIREQNEKQSYVLPNGDIVLQYKNVKRIIKLN
ncbi:MAG: hypothetical protein ACI4IS_01180 [Acutalibacteraceae bacterium]